MIFLERVHPQTQKYWQPPLPEYLIDTRPSTKQLALNVQVKTRSLFLPGEGTLLTCEGGQAGSRLQALCHDQSGDIGYSNHSLACSSLVSDSLSRPPVLRMRRLRGKASQNYRHWEERLPTTFPLLWQGRALLSTWGVKKSNTEQLRVNTDSGVLDGPLPILLINEIQGLSSSSSCSLLRPP